MKLPADAQFHEDVRLLVWRPCGVLNEAALKHIRELIGDLEGTSEKPFNRFTDTTAAEAIDLNFRCLSYAGRSPVKSAILAPSIALAHYSKMHELLTRHSSIEVRIFEDRDAAAKWLGVQVELLIISPIGNQ
jgi:hypothetical protein